MDPCHSYCHGVLDVLCCRIGEGGREGGRRGREGGSREREGGSRGRGREGVGRVGG